MTPKFQIGDSVFKAKYDRVETWVTCPDCLGSKTVRVILGDGTELTIECGGCDPGGYMPSAGRIKQYVCGTVATPYVITGVKVTAACVEYDLNNFGQGSYCTAKEEQLFATSEEAFAWGEIEKIEHEAEENKRLMAKTKDGKSWAWNATYHRKCLKEAERQIEYHRTKIKICEAKVKAAKDVAA